MSEFNLPPGVSTRDLPGFRPEDVKRDRAFEEALNLIGRQQFDRDDVVNAITNMESVKFLLLKEAISTKDSYPAMTILIEALADYVAESILRGEA